MNNIDQNITYHHCRICNGEISSVLKVKEMMYGTRDEFEYGICSICKCLQLLEIPTDLSNFYPKEYYSYKLRHKKRPWKDFRRGIKRSLVLFHPSSLTKVINFLFPKHPLFWIYRELGLNRTCKTLDVGAGSGAHVLELRTAGVLYSLGIDPFIFEDVIQDGSLIVKKGVLEDLRDQYDLITFHHSFEHIPNQLATLTQAKKLLTKTGLILIRIPTVSSYAFRKYQENWVQLDAPRHLYLHSHESIGVLTNKADLCIRKLWCDSGDGQFIGSEQYQQGITLFADNSYFMNKKISIFSTDEIRKFKNDAIQLNSQLDGDQICVVLQHKN